MVSKQGFGEDIGAPKHISRRHAKPLRRLPYIATLTAMEPDRHDRPPAFSSTTLPVWPAGHSPPSPGCATRRRPRSAPASTRRSASWTWSAVRIWRRWSRWPPMPALGRKRRRRGWLSLELRKSQRWRRPPIPPSDVERPDSEFPGPTAASDARRRNRTCGNGLSPGSLTMYRGRRFNPSDADQCPAFLIDGRPHDADCANSCNTGRDTPPTHSMRSNSIVGDNDWAFDRRSDGEMAGRGTWKMVRLRAVFLLVAGGKSAPCISPVPSTLKVPAGNRRNGAVRAACAWRMRSCGSAISAWIARTACRCSGTPCCCGAPAARPPRAWRTWSISPITECERFYPAFQFVLWGGKSPADALAAAMLECVGEA